MIKAGYKQTEVGVIPEDWEATTLLNIAPLQRGFDLPSTQLKQGVYPVIYSNGVSNYHNEYKVKGQGVITGRSGTIGKVTFIDGYYYPHNTTLWVTDFKGNEPKFIYYLYCHIGFKRFSTGSGVPTLNRNDAHRFQVPLPTKTEQTAIAKALSDTDVLIQSLSQLIAKKRQIKQGAMQTLLNPYDETGALKVGWVVRKLGDILESTQLGGNYANSEEVSDYPLIKMGNMARGKISLAKVEYIKLGGVVAKRDLLKKGNVLFNTRNTLDLVGKVSIWLNELPEAYFNSNIMRLEFKKNFVSSYIFMNWALNQQKQIQQLKGIATGTTSVAAIYTRDLMRIGIPLASKKEQNQIAQILTDMDTEITVLETKLSKYQKIKQGMMQNLLTGRIRLVTSSLQAGKDKTS